MGVVLLYIFIYSVRFGLEFGSLTHSSIKSNIIKLSPIELLTPLFSGVEKEKKRKERSENFEGR